jgi:hypothetical protein
LVKSELKNAGRYALKRFKKLINNEVISFLNDLEYLLELKLMELLIKHKDGNGHESMVKFNFR